MPHDKKNNSEQEITNRQKDRQKVIDTFIRHINNDNHDRVKYLLIQFDYLDLNSISSDGITAVDSVKDWNINNEMAKTLVGNMLIKSKKYEYGSTEFKTDLEKFIKTQYEVQTKKEKLIKFITNQEKPQSYDTKEIQEIMKIIYELKYTYLVDANEELASILELALFNKKYDIAKKILNEEWFDINHVYKDGRTVLLNLAYKSSSLDAIKFIFNNASQEIDLNVVSKTGKTPLILAVLSKKYNIKMIEFLIIKSVDINHVDAYNVSALHYAINLKRVKVAQLLLKKNVNLNIQTFSGKTALMHCLISNSYDLLTDILQKKPNLLLQDLNGKTALMFAINKLAPKSSAEGVKILINHIKNNNNSSLNIIDKSGKTALIYAIESTHEKSKELLEHLLKLKPNLELGYKKPLVLAIDSYALDKALLLIKHGAEFYINSDLAKDLFNKAVRKKNKSVIEYFKGRLNEIEWKIGVDKLNKDINSKKVKEVKEVNEQAIIDDFIEQVRQKNFNGVNTLFDKYQFIKFDSVNSSGISALDVVQKWSINDNIAELFAKKIMQREIAIKRDLSSGNIELNMLFAQINLAIGEPKSRDRKTLIDVINGRKQIQENRKKLINFITSKKVVDSKENLEEIQKIINELPSVDYLVEVNKKAIPLLIMALRNKKFNIAKMILNKKGFDINRTYNDGRTILLKLVHEKSPLELIKYIFKHAKQDIDLSLADRTGKTPLFFALANKNNDIDMIEFLLEKNIDINHIDKEGNTALMYFFYKKNFDISKLKLMLTKHPDLSLQNRNGMTLLMIAVKTIKGNNNTKRADAIKVAKYLTSYISGRNLNLVDRVSKSGKTALIYAIESKSKELQEEILKLNPNIELGYKKPLTLAIENDQLDLALLLIKKGAEFYINSDLSVDLWQKALNSNNTNVIKYLLSKLDYITRYEFYKGLNGIDLIEYFTINKYNPDVLKIILQNAEKLKIRPNNIFNALVSNIKAENYSAVNMILVYSNKSIFERIDINYLFRDTIISLSESKRWYIYDEKAKTHVRIIKMLIKHVFLYYKENSENEKNNNHHFINFLNILVENLESPVEFNDIVNVLLEQKIDVNYCDGHGRTALIHAIVSSNKNSKVLLTNLLKFNPDLELGYKKPLVLAIEHGKLDEALLLIEKGAEFDINSDLSSSLWKKALVEKNTNVIKYFFNNFSNIENTSFYNPPDNSNLIEYCLAKRHPLDVFKIIFKNAKNLNISNNDMLNALSRAIDYRRGDFLKITLPYLDKSNFNATKTKQLLVRCLYYFLNVPEDQNGKSKSYLEMIKILIKYIGQYSVSNNKDSDIKTNKDVPGILGEKYNISELLIKFIKEIKSPNELKDIVELFLEQDINLNYTDKDGRSVLHYAIMYNRDKIMRIILDKIKSNGLDAKSHSGKTALMYYFATNSTVSLSKILKKKPSLLLKDKDGKTALMFAIAKAESKSSFESIELLINHIKGNNNSSIDIVDKSGKTALIYAIESYSKKSIELVRNILKLNPNLELGYKKPLALAIESSNLDLALLLIRNEANLDINSELAKDLWRKAQSNKKEEIIEYFKSRSEEIKWNIYDDINEKEIKVIKDNVGSKKSLYIRKPKIRDDREKAESIIQTLPIGKGSISEFTRNYSMSTQILAHRISSYVGRINKLAYDKNNSFLTNVYRYLARSYVYNFELKSLLSSEFKKNSPYVNQDSIKKLKELTKKTFHDIKTTMWSYKASDSNPLDTIVDKKIKEFLDNNKVAPKKR